MKEQTEDKEKVIEVQNYLDELRKFPYNTNQTAQDRCNQLKFISTHLTSSFNYTTSLLYVDEAKTILENIRKEIFKINTELTTTLQQMVSERITYDEPLNKRIVDHLERAGILYLFHKKKHDSDPYTVDIRSFIAISHNEQNKWSVETKIPIWTKGFGSPSAGMASHYVHESIFFDNVSRALDPAVEFYKMLYENKYDQIGEVVYDALELPCNAFELIETHRITPCFYGKLHEAELRFFHGNEKGFGRYDKLLENLELEANMDMERVVRKVGILRFKEAKYFDSVMVKNLIHNLHLEHASFPEMRGLVMQGVAHEGMVALKNLNRGEYYTQYCDAPIIKKVGNKFQYDFASATWNKEFVVKVLK